MTAKNESYPLERVLSSLLLFILLFPQLPVVFQRSELHINIVAISLSILALLLYRTKLEKKLYIIPFIYFFSLQCFLFLSGWFGTEDFLSFGEVPSYFRPTMLLIVTLGFLTMMKDVDSLYHNLVRLAKILTVAIFIYSILEVFLFNYFSKVMFILYRLEDKSNIDGVAVSFFTLPYYGAYIMCTLFPLLLSNYEKNKGRSFFYILMLVISVVLTQSKMGVFLLIGIVFLYWFISVSFKKKVVVLLFFCLFALVMVLSLQEFVAYLNATVGGNFARTLHLMLSNTDQAHNLLERLDDIIETYQAISQHNFFVGIGLGKGETIEVWIAMIMYRYGLTGLFFFIMFFLIIGVKAMLMAMKKDSYSYEKQSLLKFVSIWALTIYISQLSGLMLEMSKGGVLSCLMFAVASKCIMDSKPKINEIAK
ncbi:hypothetical protein [Pseudoalteromonas prydzensis]|uniref:hypothetical protein n=1 Tax=Pseudoalteromonas prydzensis TaxID=182141 RepID=UPI0037042732